jgi:hypothetical protein
MNGHGRQGSVGSRMPPSAGSGNPGSQGYAMNLPPSSYRISKSPRTRSPSLSGASLKASPLPIPSENIFTFPPKLARDAGPLVAASTPRSLRTVASQPALNAWRDPRAPLMTESQEGSSPDARPLQPPVPNDTSELGSGSDYEPPSYRGRPRTASLKSVHHYKSGLANARWSHNGEHDNNKLKPTNHKHSRPRSSTLAANPLRKSVSKSQSISSFFNMPSATSSLTWIGQHLHSRSPSVQGPNISSPNDNALTVMIGPDTASNSIIGTPNTSSSSASSGGSSLAWTDPSEGLVFWQEGDRSKAGTRHQRLCSLGGDDDKDKTPMPKRTLQIDTRLAQKQYRQAHVKQDPPNLRASPRGEMPLFFVPPTQARGVQ